MAGWKIIFISKCSGQQPPKFDSKYEIFWSRIIPPVLACITDCERTGCSEESSGLRSRRRGAVAATVERRVWGEPHAAAAPSTPQPLD